ncbi:uncharacterized protein [Drosophila tropicalis]|uniref:uncharacterized protein n=1 Tax=Drosophila tropicalis TaxID=46794 RepID=UPI0035ABA9CF
MTTTTSPTPIVFENGTMLGSMSHDHRSLTKLQFPGKQSPFIIPEIVISSSQSNNSLHRSRCDIPEEPEAEHTALLDSQHREREEEAEFEQFVMNRTTSESNILESSIYSELQFPPSLCVAGPQTAVGTPPPPTATATLNTSACSRTDSESRQGKRTRRKGHKSKAKCSNNSLAGAAAATTGVPGGAPVASAVGVGGVGSYPPQYTTIFLDPHHHHHVGAAVATNPPLGNTTSQFLAGPGSSVQVPGSSEAASYLQYHQYYQQRPIMTNVGQQFGHGHHHLHHARRTLLDVAVPLAGSNVETGSHLATANVSTTQVELTGGYSFRKWFARPSLPFVIGIFALGGVACTLGGIVLGSTGLIEHSTQYLSAALLMIGIGVSLLVISGAIWRLSLPDDVDDCPCFRRMETCRNCNSPHCSNRLLPGSYLYPEFQHRPPPPSYLTSLNEYAFVYHPSSHPTTAAYTAVRMNTPPPLYRSTYSLNTSATHGASPGLTLPRTSEQPADEQAAILLTREAISQTSFKEIEIDEIAEDPTAIPLRREPEIQTLYKEAELD